LGVSAIWDGGLVAEVSPDRISSSPDMPELVYRQSTQQFVKISAGDDETCGLKSDGSMLCWGYFGDFPVSSAFGTGYVPRPPSEGWKQVSLWGGLACGIENDDALVCWGNEDFNLHPPAGTYLAVDARAPCAIRLSDGGIVCWGWSQDWANPVPEGSFKALSIGDVGCALRTDDTVICWGKSRIMAAMGVYPDGTFVQIAEGGLFACGLRGDGQLVCWGSVEDWASTTDSREAPQPQGTFVQIAAGADAACGVRTDGTLACWGMVWGLVPPEGNYLQISIGYTEPSEISVYFCALRTDGIVVCWGENNHGAASPP
jgi:alpha-tubulin suppressor-like RCC1 family protein